MGWIAEDPGVSFLLVERLHGLRAARRAWQAWHRAALDFAALVRRLDLKCALEPRNTLVVATTPEQSTALKRDRKARREAGLEAPVVTPRTITAEAALAAAIGLRGHGGATLDPYRAAVGLADAAAERGARLFENSAATKVTFAAKSASVELASGDIRADRVVIATGMPTSR